MEAVVPSWGVSGTVGQVVTIAGSHFEQGHDLSCRFGLVGIAAGRYVTSTMVACTAPEHGPGSVMVTVSNGAGQHEGSTGVRYEYKMESGTWEAKPSRGPVTGGTLVTVTGTAVELSSGGVDCIFGGDRVAAEEGADHMLVCVVPMSKAVGTVDMWLAQSSSETRVGGSGQFEYYEAPRVQGLRPSRGSVTGGTAVNVTGTGFRGDDGLRCRFGGMPDAAGSMARWLTTTVVMCIAPGAADGQTGPVAVEVSVNEGADFTSDGKTYMYERGATVEAVVPSWGVSGTVGQVGC